jgi:hypothetical protein
MSKTTRVWTILIALALLLAIVPIGAAQGPTSQWSRPIDITQPSNSEVGEWGVLTCDQYQNTHMFWSDMNPDGAAIYYRNNIGGTWSPPADIILNPDHEALRPAVDISSKTDTIHLIWVDRELRADLYYSRAPLQNAADPHAWSEPQMIAANTDGGSLAIDKDGVIHLVYQFYDADGLQLAVYYIRSDDDGITWSDPATVFAMTAPVPSTLGAKLALDDAGRLHVGITVRSYKYGVYSELDYSQSEDGGKTWMPYKRIDASIVDPTGNYVTTLNLSTITPYTFGKDEVHLTWHTPKRMHMWSYDGGKTWSAPIEIMPLPPALGGPNKLVKDSAGVLHVVTAVQGGVFSASWDGKKWSTPERIDDRGIDPHNQDMVVCGGNELHVTYDDRNDSRKVWYSTRSVDAPHIEAKPIPSSENTTTAASQALAPTLPPVNLTTAPRSQSLSSELKTPPQSPSNLIVLSALPVMVLIAGI